MNAVGTGDWELFQSSQESREKEDRRKESRSEQGCGEERREESTSSQAPPEKDNPQTDHPIILTRLFSYTDKVFGLRKQWKLRVSDALYQRPSVIGLLGAHGKHLVAVLKENQPELLSEARTLLPGEPAREFHTPAAPGKPARHIQLREAEGFRTETITEPLRVVHAHETGTRRQRIAGRWHESPIDSHWYWATTLPAALAGGRAIFDFGHDRWKIENEGFNELVTRWHSGHSFHHHPNSMLVLWLMLFMAHAVFHCFHARNLKAELRCGHTAIYFAGLLAACLRTRQWWPPPT